MAVGRVIKSSKALGRHHSGIARFDPDLIPFIRPNRSAWRNNPDRRLLTERWETIRPGTLPYDEGYVGDTNPNIQRIPPPGGGPSETVVRVRRR